MAHLKGLNIISVTDHNSMLQYPILMEIAESYDLLCVPGIEVTTIEEIDLLIYFKTFEDAMMFDHQIADYQSKSPYNKDVYGVQVITDIHDQPDCEIDHLLSKPLNLSIKDLIRMLKAYPHVLIPAHLNKSRRSAIHHLKDIPCDAIEVMIRPDMETFIQKNNLDGYIIMYNSDAHQLTDIMEKTAYNQITLDYLDIEAFFRYFKHG
jgi:PHP family Zn ribbon phosphoesterase